MHLTEQLTDYVNACFTGIYVQTLEPDEAERDLTRHAAAHKWKLAVWDIAQGLRLPGQSGTVRSDAGPGDPLAVLRALPGLAERDGTAVLLLRNFHRLWNSAEVVQTTFAQLVAGKQQRTFIVILAPVVQIPVELEKLFVVLHHELPGRAQLERIARELTTDEPVGLPETDGLKRVLDAAAGLTRLEAEGAFALSIARHGVIRPEVVTELKAQTLKKNNLLTLHRGGERFDTLGDLTNLKDFCRSTGQAGEGKRSVVGRGPRHGEVSLREIAWQRNGPADADPRHGLVVRFAGRCHGGERPAGVEDRRRDGSLHPVLR